MSAADHVFDRYSTVTRPLLDRYVRYTAVRALGAAITPLCFYVLGAFLPSVPGRARDADPLIKTPPVTVGWVMTNLAKSTHQRQNGALGVVPIDSPCKLGPTNDLSGIAVSQIL